MNECMNKRAHCTLVNELMIVPMNGWKNVKMNEWIDERANE